MTHINLSTEKKIMDLENRLVVAKGDREGVGCFNKLELIFLQEKKNWGEFLWSTPELNPTRNHEVVGSIPGLTQWVKDLPLP